MKARYYQVDAEAALWNFLISSDADRHPVIAMPTGTGKAFVIADFIRGIMTTWPGQRVLMLVDVKELVSQNAKTLRQIWPNAPLGIFSAGLKEKTTGMPITFAGIQSAAKKPEVFGHIDLVFIDECHMVSPDHTAAYLKFINALHQVNPKMRVIGLSATIFRLGLGLITEGGLFTDVCYDITGLHEFNKLLDEGYLSHLIPMPTRTVLDVSGVHKRGGDFVASELQNAVGREEITRQALAEAVVAAQNRNHWLIYCAGIDHVRMVVWILGQMGISAKGIHSKMVAEIDGNRDENIELFKAGKIQALVNADVLTKGYDHPALDCIILLRPTSSPGLHVQILGRGTRPYYAEGFDLETAEGRLAAIAASVKPNCLVLDFAGNTARLGPINDPRIPKKKGEGNGQIPIKVCNECGCMAHISARVCVNCGAEFPIQEKIETQASTNQLIARAEAPVVNVFPVDKVTYKPHVKPGFPASLKVTYYCGLRRFDEWVCVQHHGMAIHNKAVHWWRQRMNGDDPPMTLTECLALVDKLKTPKQIRVWVNKKYPEIIAYQLNEDEMQ